MTNSKTCVLDSSVSELLKYKDIHDFWRQHGLASRREKWAGQSWRLADMSVGWVHGIASLTGIACATDGVVLIVRDVHGNLFDVHLDSWVNQELSEPREYASLIKGQQSRKRSDGTATITITMLSNKSRALETLLEEFMGAGQ